MIMACKCIDPDYEIVRAYYSDGSNGYVCVECGDDIEMEFDWHDFNCERGDNR